jgi:hypothetical protein
VADLQSELCHWQDRAQAAELLTEQLRANESQQEAVRASLQTQLTAECSASQELRLQLAAVTSADQKNALPAPPAQCLHETAAPSCAQTSSRCPDETGRPLVGHSGAELSADSSRTVEDKGISDAYAAKLAEMQQDFQVELNALRVKLAAALAVRSSLSPTSAEDGRAVSDAHAAKDSASWAGFPLGTGGWVMVTVMIAGLSALCASLWRRE